MSNNICFSCGSPSDVGVKILDNFLCGECEAAIVKTGVEEDDYQKWIRICELWDEQLINTLKEE